MLLVPRAPPPPRRSAPGPDPGAAALGDEVPPSLPRARRVERPQAAHTEQPRRGGLGLHDAVDFNYLRGVGLGPELDAPPVPVAPVVGWHLRHGLSNAACLLHRGATTVSFFRTSSDHCCRPPPGRSAYQGLLGRLGLGGRLWRGLGLPGRPRLGLRLLLLPRLRLLPLLRPLGLGQSQDALIQVVLLADGLDHELVPADLEAGLELVEDSQPRLSSPGREYVLLFPCHPAHLLSPSSCVATGSAATPSVLSCGPGSPGLLGRATL